jgi:hypothetical protein
MLRLRCGLAEDWGTLMLEPTCDTTETPVQLEAPNRNYETKVSLPSLTEVVESGYCWQRFRGVYMPSVKLTVRFSFATGEEVVTSVETPAVSADSSNESVAPYSFGGATAPEQPVLVSSTNFIRVE